MADLDGINTLFRTLIRQTMGMPSNAVRPANQAAPVGLPSAPFATVLITDVNSSALAITKQVNQASPSLLIDESVIVHSIVSLSIQFFNGLAFTQAQRLGVLLQSSAVIERMNVLGIGLLKIGVARNLTGLIDTFWESRGQIDLEFSLLAREQMVLGTYGTFPLAVHYESPPSTMTKEVIAP